jgi:hypothetical protein
MEIDLLEPVQLGKSTQWIRIRAANARNPLLLLVQMGPGLPASQDMTQALRRASAHSPSTGPSRRTPPLPQFNRRRGVL